MGGPLQRPGIMQGSVVRGIPPPRHYVLVYGIWDVMCKSHTAYMTRYIARAGQEPKGRSLYGSLEEARGALGSDFHWKMCTSVK